jgi:transglutaminase-like putative cysteine protease
VTKKQHVFIFLVINFLMHHKIPLLIILLLPLAFASSPWFINDMDARITFTGTIDIDHEFTSSKTNWVEGSFFIVPKECPLQSSELIRVSPISYTLENDEYDNQFIKFRWTKPADGHLEYELIWDVYVARLQYTIPSVGNMDDSISENVQQFLEPDDLTLWTGFMNAKAESLIEGSNSTLEAVRRLSEWVSRYLTYDRSCWSESYPAKTTYHSRIGVCDEFTNLFSSLARSVGIPVRYVEGLVYSGEEWNYHAWAEVYIGEWLPVDPTYNEVGFVDSSHISLAKVMSDSDVYNRLNWEGVKTSASFGDDNFDVQINKMSPRSLIALDIDAKEEASGSEMLEVTAHLLNLANSNVVVTCSLNMPVEMHLLDWDEKSIVLGPNEDSSLSWKIATPSDLDKKWIHKMPLNVMCFPGTNLTKTLTVDPRSSMPLIPNASIIDLTILNSSNVLVLVRNEGTKPLEDLVTTLCIDNGKSVCVNQTIEVLYPAEVGDLLFTGVLISVGDTVSAKLYSPEFEAEAMEALMRELADAQLPKEPEPVDDTLDFFPDVTEVMNGRGDDALLIAVAASFAIILFYLIFTLFRR